MHDFSWNSQSTTESTQAKANIDASQSKSTEVTHLAKKISMSEVTDMETENQNESKKLKVLTGKENIDIEQMQEQRFEFPTTFIEEEVLQQEIESK